jgi:hypothetical protein
MCTFSTLLEEEESSVYFGITKFRKEGKRAVTKKVLSKWSANI